MGGGGSRKSLSHGMHGHGTSPVRDKKTDYLSVRDSRKRYSAEYQSEKGAARGSPQNSSPQRINMCGDCPDTYNVLTEQRHENTFRGHRFMNDSGGRQGETRRGKKFI